MIGPQSILIFSIVNPGGHSSSFTWTDRTNSLKSSFKSPVELGLPSNTISLLDTVLYAGLISKSIDSTSLVFHMNLTIAG